MRILPKPRLSIACTVLLLAATLAGCSTRSGTTVNSGASSCNAGQQAPAERCLESTLAASPPAPQSSAPATNTAVPTPSTPAPPAASFPPGYPKIVRVSSLLDQVKNWYKMSNLTQA